MQHLIFILSHCFIYIVEKYKNVQLEVILRRLVSPTRYFPNWTMEDFISTETSTIESAFPPESTTTPLRADNDLKHAVADD